MVIGTAINVHKSLYKSRKSKLIKLILDVNKNLSFKDMLSNYFATTR